MKKNRVLSLFLSIPIAVSMFAGTVLVRAEESAGVDAPVNDDWLHVVGNKIVDKNGKEVWLTGTNWFGFNTGSGVFDGVWSCNMKAAIKGMADHGINLLRIPMSVQILNEWEAGVYPKSQVNDFVNPELKGKNSMQLFEIAMQHCKEFGIKVMVDIHSAPSAAFGHNIPVWYDGSYTTDNFYQALEWLTEKYKNDDTLIAIDLKNEPHGNPNQSSVDFAKWDNSKDKNNWKYVAEQAGKKVLAINPNLLIMIEGVEAIPKDGYTYADKDEHGKTSKYYFNWWGGNLRGVRTMPVDLGSGNSQIVYSPHDYGPMVFQQPWFTTGFTKESVYNDCWKDNWAYIYEEGISPLLIGEWGGFMDGGPNQKWMEAIRDYIVENKIHHTFWCYNANSGDTGGLVSYDFMTWDKEKYALLKPALWQNSDGKFIGLDHEVPLGSNGINLSEYSGTTVTSPTKNTPKVTPTVKPSVTPTQKPDPTASQSTSVTLSGYIKSDISDSAEKSDFVMKLGGQLLTTTDSDGYYEFKNVAPSKSYSISISKPGYVAMEIENITIDSKLQIGSKQSPIVMFAGDVKNDNVVNMQDIIELAKSFNATTESEDYTEACDVNKDGFINMSDVMIIARNFGKSSSDYKPMI